jgi:hypothetical protein
LLHTCCKANRATCTHFTMVNVALTMHAGGGVPR